MRKRDCRIHAIRQGRVVLRTPPRIIDLCSIWRQVLPSANHSTLTRIPSEESFHEWLDSISRRETAHEEEVLCRELFAQH